MRCIVFIVFIIKLSSVKSQFLDLNFTLPDILPETVFQVFSSNIPEQLSALQNTIGRVSDEECSLQLTLYIDGLRNMEEWALKMLDATAKVQPGLLEGNLMHVGHYDECLKINVVVKDSQVYGQYCTSYITQGIVEIPTDLADLYGLYKMSYGLCLPAACNATSLAQIARLMEESFNSPYHFNFADDLCTSASKPVELSVVTIVAITIFGCFGVIVVFSTLFETFLLQNKKSQDPSLFTAFSLYTNGTKLLSTKKSADSLGCLNGLRVISLIWIIGGHRYLYTSFIPLINLLDVLEWPNKSISGIITASNMAVDTFFVVSGLLVIYVYLLYKEKGKSMSLGLFYLHRFLRLTPVLAATVLFYVGILEHIGYGPFWKTGIRPLQKDCEDNWWATLLYVQNYVYPKHGCVSHTWYLAVDTQLYVLSPFLLFPLTRWPKCTVFLVTCLIALCCGVTMGISWQKELAPAYFGMRTGEMEFLYTVTHVRAVAWLTGFILGYILFQIRGQPIKMNKVMQVLLWLISLSIPAGVIAYHANLVEDVDVLEAAIANGLLRLAWAISVSILIFLCVTGHGGLINGFLSSSIFTVLIRINYSTYLVHMIVIIWSLGQTVTPQYESQLGNLYYFWGDYAISCFLAVTWTLVFESPILILEKLIFGKPKSKQREPVALEGFNHKVSVEDGLNDCKQSS